jgi:uncharacterized protein (DUF1330 family)
MAAYALAHVRQVTMGPEIVAYLEGIDATLAPFGGHFLVHGDVPEILEGRWTGHVIIIEFPDISAARAWYQSPAYQAIVRLRIDHSDGDCILVPGVQEGHRATDILSAMEALPQQPASETELR